MARSERAAGKRRAAPRVTREAKANVTEPLRIVQYITPSHIGGAEVHVIALSEKLRERGHQVTVICPRGRPLTAELIARALPVWAPRTTGKVDPVLLLRLARRLRRDGAQVIHTHLSTASLLGSLAARLAGIPSLATVHGLNTRTCYNYARAIIAVSNAVRHHLVNQGLPPERITVIHNGVDLRAFSRAAGGAEVGQHWGIPEAGTPPPSRARGGEGAVLVTVGRLAPAKGHRDLLHALAVLVLADSRWREVRLLIVGAGALLSELRHEAQRLGLAERVVFVGFHRDVLPFLQAADIFVLPSTQEGLSLSALEAMAMSKPVVACRVGGTPEVVVDGQTGLLVSPGRPAELAGALERLLSHPEEAKAMGAAGQQRVREAFDLEQMVTKIEQMYRNLIAGHGE
jgi:glycosyltransferase involved in cell wall biosynthesis